MFACTEFFEEHRDSTHKQPNKIEIFLGTEERIISVVETVSAVFCVTKSLQERASKEMFREPRARGTRSRVS